MKTTILFLFAAGCSVPVNGLAPADLFDDAGHRIGDNPEASGDAAPVCYSATARGVAIIANNTATVPCTAVGIDANVINNHAVGYIVSNPMLDCSVHEAPIECSTCDYTCDCLLRYVASPGPTCVCSQAGPGAPIVLTGCGS
jgi:hypothetical protein